MKIKWLIKFALIKLFWNHYRIIMSRLNCFIWLTFLDVAENDMRKWIPYQNDNLYTVKNMIVIWYDWLGQQLFLNQELVDLTRGKRRLPFEHLQLTPWSSINKLLNFIKQYPLDNHFTELGKGSDSSCSSSCACVRVDYTKWLIVPR